MQLAEDDHKDLHSTTVERIERVLMLFRKLREGIIASRRTDAFAIEAYETSALLALRIGNHPQLVSSLGVLVPGLYMAHDASSGISGALGALSFDQPKRSRRPLFAALLLLYRLAYQDSPTAFWKSWMELSGSRVRAAISAQTKHGALCLLAHRALVRPDPLLYHSLVRALASTEIDQPNSDGLHVDDRRHLRRVLSLASDRMQVNTHRMITIAYGRSGTSEAWRSELMGEAVDDETRRRRRDRRTAGLLGIRIAPFVEGT